MLDRLVHKLKDQHPYIKRKILEFRAFLTHLVTEHRNQLVRIPAEQSLPEIRKGLVEALETHSTHF